MHERIYWNIVNNNCTIMRAQLTKQLIGPCTSPAPWSCSDRHCCRQAGCKQGRVVGLVVGVLFLSKWHTGAFDHFTVKLATFMHFLHEATVNQSIRFAPHLWPVAFILLPNSASKLTTRFMLQLFDTFLLLDICWWRYSASVWHKHSVAPWSQQLVQPEKA